jgi:hypothetical protein
MKSKSIKNIIIVSVALLVIMIVSTSIVIGFNFIIGFSTDVNNDDVATFIALVAFIIALIWKILYEKIYISNEE